jgi:hypothetical protein
MKALILAGGAGTRLRPITHTRAKQLVPVANKPILFYGIEAMVAAGITEIGVIVGDTRAEVMAALGDGSSFGASITYIPQDAPLGLAHCVLIAREFLGDDDFVMYLGDNLLEQDLAAFVAAFRGARDTATPPEAQILLKQVPDPHRFGIASLDDAGNVVALVEKPADPPSDLALVGVYLFTRRVHDAVACDRSRRPRRARDHRCDPVAARRRAPCALRAAHRLVDRHRQAHPVARGEPAAAREGSRPCIDGHVDEGPPRRPRARRRRRQRSSTPPSAVRSRSAPAPGSSTASSGRSRRSARRRVVEHSEIEHSVVMDESIRRHPAPGGQPDRFEDAWCLAPARSVLGRCA